MKNKLEPEEVILLRLVGSNYFLLILKMFNIIYKYNYKN